jgi:hypothetical protein
VVIIIRIYDKKGGTQMMINKMKYKLISTAAVLLSLTLLASLAFASGGGPVTSDYNMSYSP